MQGNNQGPAQLVASVGSGVGVAATQFSNKAKEEAKIAKTIGNAVSAARHSPSIFTDTSLRCLLTQHFGPSGSAVLHVCVAL